MKVIKPKAKAAKNAGKKKELPSDTYEPLMEKHEIEVDDSRKFVVNVQRGGEFGLPCVDIRTYQTTEAFTGFTRKGINFPLDLLPDLIQVLEEVADAAEERKLFEDFAE